MKKNTNNDVKTEEKSQFVNMTLPTDWGKKIVSNGRKFVSVRIPVKEEDEKFSYYSFIVPEEKLHKSEKQEGMSYFGFPRKVKDNEEQDFMVTLRTSIKQEDGSYKNEDREVSSSQLKEYVEAAKERKAYKDNLISVEISEKLVHYFEGKDNHVEYAKVSVPLEDEFVGIVVKRTSILTSEREGKVCLSMFKNAKDGKPYTFTATQGVKQLDGSWENVELKITSQEIVDSFTASREKYKQEHSDNTAPGMNEEQKLENPSLGGR